MKETNIENEINIYTAISLLKKDGELPKEPYRSICENNTGGGGPCGACGAC